MISYETTKVRMIETIEVSQTSEVSGASKFIFRSCRTCALAIASLMKYESALETSIMMRITKIQTSSCTCTVGSLHGQQDEGDQRDAGDAVSFKAVGAGADRVARVVAGAVGDHAGVARIVFLDLEDDLHQVGADVGDLGEDAAGDTQRRRAQRFADGEADEARSRIVCPGMNSRMQSMISSSTLISIMPMLMPAFSGIA